MASPLYTPDGDPSAGGGDDAGGSPGFGERELVAGLNAAQREAVTAPPGPLLVVAGAGTGKTRVLTRRVAWKVLRGASPRALLAITFTNKAADVLKERLASVPGGRNVTAGTFHGYCAMLLRRYADRIGGTREFTILDTDDQTRLLRDLLDDLGISTTTHRPEAFASAISHRKNGSAGRAPATLRDPSFVANFDRVVKGYAARLKASGLYDFDDLLLEAVRLLTEVEDVRLACRDRWRHVLVDEYQDTNATQTALLKALVGEAPDLTVVGDPDQSIYRWRGASIRNILQFGDDFPGARVVKLEENYRSTQRIVGAAEAVIAKNAQRYDKRLRTTNDVGEPVLEVRARDPVEEGQRVVRLLTSWREDGIPWNEMAVFVRVNHASRAVEIALRNAGLPYAVVSGVEFFQRREVKDVLAWARLVTNPRDEAAFARAIQAPRRGIGATTMARLRAAATARGVSVPEAAMAKVEGVSKKARASLDAFFEVLLRLRARPRAPVGPLFQAIVTDSGYRRELLLLEDEVERSRIENVDELVAAAHEADRLDPTTTLEAFLERTALVAEQDGLEAGAPRVSLMTVHAAKGLEFDGVVVVGAEEGWFPHARSTDRAEEVEEERRLFYVAMTRARRRLALTHAQQRESWNGLERRLPSRFLLDVPDELVTVRDPTGTYARGRARAEVAATAKARPFGRGGLRGRAGEDVAEDAVDEAPDDLPTVTRPADADVDVGPVVARGEAAGVRVGERVAHPYFGHGEVVAATGSGPSSRVTVAFDEAGTRTMLWTLANLTRLPPSGGGGRP